MEWNEMINEIRLNNAVLIDRQRGERKITVKCEDTSGFEKLVKHPFKKNTLVWSPF